MYKLTFNGQDNPEWLVFTGSPLEISGDFELILKEIGGRAGAILQRKQKKATAMQYPCYIKAADRADLNDKKRQLQAWLDTDEEEELSYSDDPGIYMQAIWTNEGGFQHLVNDGEGALTFLRLSPSKYSGEIPEVINTNPQNIVVGGLEKTFPIVEVDVQQDSTFFSIIKENVHFAMGNPTVRNEGQEYEAETMLLHDTMSSLVGWTAGANIDGGIVNGLMVSNGQSFIADFTGVDPQPYTQGPAIKKSLSEPVTDFIVEVKIAMKYSESQGSPNYGQDGRVEVYLLGPTGEHIGKLAIRTRDYGYSRNTAEIRIGDLETGHYIQSGYDPKTPVNGWADFEGILRIEKRGNEYKTLVSNVYGEQAYPREVEYIDAGNAYTPLQLAQVQAHIGQAHAMDMPDVARIDDIRVWKINPPQGDKSPYLLRAGDHLKIDFAKKEILINGLDRTAEFDLFSEYFPLLPGSNLLALYPENIGTTLIRYKERWK
jgi:predicted phage tail component-like protein